MAKQKPEAITGFDLTGLEPLTEKQMNFVKGIWAGLSASKAYRQAFDCSTMSENCILGAASELRNNGVVTKWISAGYAAHLGSAKYTIDQHINELAKLKQLALENNNVSAAVQAEQVMGKAAGLHIDRVQEVPLDPTEMIREIAKVSPAYAQQLAREAGVTLDGLTGETQH